MKQKKNIQTISKTLALFKLVPITLCLMPVFANFANASEKPLKRWAIIEDDKALASIVDLLTVKLSEDIELLERSDSKKALKEIEFQKLNKAVSRRQIGKILKADALGIISQEKSNNQDIINLIICECNLGARLKSAQFAFKKDNPELTADKIAEEINKTRFHFSKGIEQIIGVSPFLSKNLTYEYDQLQIGYSHLIQNALSEIPGVAVIEIEEAREIQKELSGNAINIKREKLVPCFISGSFRMSGEKPEVTVSLELNIKANGKENKIENKIKLNKVPEYLTTEFLKKTLNKTKDFTPLTTDEQCKSLKERADSFSSLGYYFKSTELREAYLLLKPEDKEQRKNILAEYKLACETLPEQNKSVELIRKKAETYKFAYPHMEYLIRNKLLKGGKAKVMVQARDLCYFNLRYKKEEKKDGKNFVYFIGDRIRRELKETEREFLLNLYQPVKKLPELQGHGSNWTEYVISSIIDYDYNRSETRWFFLIKNYIRDDIRFLINNFPDFKKRPSDSICSLLDYTAEKSRFLGQYENTLTQKEWIEFLMELEKSKDPLISLYGEYGLLSLDWSKEEYTKDIKKLKKYAKRAEKINKKFKQICLKYNLDDEYNPFDTSENILDDVEKRLKPKTSKVPKYKRPVEPERNTGRLKFEQLQISKVPKADNIVNCGGKADFFWTEKTTRCYLMSSNNMLHQIEPKWGWLYSAGWDGENIWISDADEIFILDLKGKLLKRIGREEGLPPCNNKSAHYGLLIFPFESGKALAAGSFGKDERGWLAIVEYKSGKVKVDVFHEATRTVNSEHISDKKYDRIRDNPYLAFAPNAIIPCRSDDYKKPKKVMVERNSATAQPLVVDLNTKKVGVYPKSIWLTTSLSFFSINDVIICNDPFNKRVGLIAPPGKKWENHEIWKIICKDNEKANNGYQQGTFGKFNKPFIEYEDAVYLTGPTWWRIDLKTLKDERFVPWKLPNKYAYLNIGVSGIHGLIGWDDKSLYKISISPKPNTIEK